jgi:hypothetical protein
MAAPFMYTAELSGSDTVFTGEGLWGGYLIEMDGANDQDVTFYDNTTNSGTIIKPGATLDAASDAENGVILTNPVKCNIGLYCEITGGGTVKVIVYYNTKTKHM